MQASTASIEWLDTSPQSQSLVWLFILSSVVCLLLSCHLLSICLACLCPTCEGTAENAAARFLNVSELPGPHRLSSHPPKYLGTRKAPSSCCVGTRMGQPDPPRLSEEESAESESIAILSDVRLPVFSPTTFLLFAPLGIRHTIFPQHSKRI